MEGGSRVHGMLPSAHVHLEVEVRARGFGVAGISHVTDYRTGTYARSIVDVGSVRELRIAKVVLRSRIVFVQMIVEVLIAVVAAQEDRIALPTPGPRGRNPVDGATHDRENRRPFRAK